MASAFTPYRPPPADRSPASSGYRPVARSQAWAPIRTLSAGHLDSIREHLLALDAEDRYLRFGHPVSEAQIERYVSTLDFERDALFGIFDHRLELIALSHLAYPSPSPSGRTTGHAEFGVSVLEKARHHGCGARLFDRAVKHARNRQIDTLLIHTLSENAAMLKIARKAGARVERSGSDSTAYLKLPPDTFATHFEELFEDQAAEMDYQFKRQVRYWTRLMETMTRVPGLCH